MPLTACTAPRRTWLGEGAFFLRTLPNFGTYCPNQRSLCPALREWTKREAGPRKQESKFFPERVIRKIWHLPLSLLNGRWLVPAARKRVPDEEGAVRGVSKKAAWEGHPRSTAFSSRGDLQIRPTTKCVILMRRISLRRILMRRISLRRSSAGTSGAHNGRAGRCRQESIMDASPHWEGQTKYKGWDDWSECYTLLLLHTGFGAIQQEQEWKEQWTGNVKKCFHVLNISCKCNYIVIMKYAMILGFYILSHNFKPFSL